MRLHIVGLPYSQLDCEYDGFTTKVRNLAQMFPDSFVYAGDVNPTDARLVTCITTDTQQMLLGNKAWWNPGTLYMADWNDQEIWEPFNLKVISEIAQRIAPQDIICLPIGYPMKPIVDAFSSHLCVETGVGYEGIYAPYRVWESYSWMHTINGRDAKWLTPAFFDAVIPPMFEPPEREYGCPRGKRGTEGAPGGVITDWRPRKGAGFFLFASRMIVAKGYQIAIDVAKELDTELVVIGEGEDRPDGPTYTGLVSTQERTDLITEARAVFCPTLYTEPFGRVVGESLICGTPVICSDWGAFVENVQDGVDGFRCRSMAEFIAAANNVDDLSRTTIQKRAMERYSQETISAQYTSYFERLSTLWGDGFYQHKG